MAIITNASDIDAADTLFVIGAAVFTTLLSEGMPHDLILKHNILV